MADVELCDLRDGSDWLNIVERETMPGVRFDAVLGSKCHCIGNPAKFGFALSTLTMGVFASVEFDDGRAQPDRGFDLARVGFDK